MDAFAHQQNRTGGTPWISVNWDAWHLEDDQEQVTAISADLARLAMTPVEGGEAFGRIVAAPPAGQVVVSTEDLPTRIDRLMQQIASLHDRPQAGADGDSAPLHARPQLQNDYVAPETELERTIAQVWQRALGFEQIGVHDNFFELGGDSFIAVQVVSRLRKELNQDIPAAKLYQGLTIRALAALLEDAGQSARRRAAELGERKEQMGRRKRYQQTRRSRH
jgi:acyl carrier protein